jgi:DNA-binding CsgD family transcriptional regulator
VGIPIHSDYAKRSVRLVAALARAVNGREFGKHLIANLKELFGFGNTAFILLDNETFEISYPIFGNIPRSAIERYRDCYRDEGIFLRAIMEERKLLTRKFITALDVMSADSYDRSVYYRDIVSPAKAHDSVVLPLGSGRRISGGLAIFKPIQDGPFTELDKKIFSLLNEPLGALLDSHLESLTLRAETTIDESIFASLRTGVIVVDQHNQIVRKNAVAEHLCERIYPGDPSSAVAKLLSALWERRNLGKEKADAIPDFEGSKVSVKVVPMSYITPLQTIAFRYAVYVEDRTDDDERFQKFADTYALSRRELQIVSRVVAGEDNTVIADKLYLSDNTVRTHLQNIYRKLSINSRISIIQLFRELA